MYVELRWWIRIEYINVCRTKVLWYLTLYVLYLSKTGLLWTTYLIEIDFSSPDFLGPFLTIFVTVVHISHNTAQKNNLSRLYLIIYLAPGYCVFPRLTSSCILSILNGVTISGKVRFCAIDLGTPTWSIRRFGSGVITVRAEKSTRFPIKFPLILPSLLYTTEFIHLINQN